MNVEFEGIGTKVEKSAKYDAAGSDPAKTVLQNMVKADPDTYDRILEGPMAYWFNELCKLAQLGGQHGRGRT